MTTTEIREEISTALSGEMERDIELLKEIAKSYEGKPEGYLWIRECWRQIAILTPIDEAV